MEYAFSEETSALSRVLKECYTLDTKNLITQQNVAQMLDEKNILVL